METFTFEMVVPAPEFDEAVPVIAPPQLAP